MQLLLVSCAATTCSVGAAPAAAGRYAAASPGRGRHQTWRGRLRGCCLSLLHDGGDDLELVSSCAVTVRKPYAGVGRTCARLLPLRGLCAVAARACCLSCCTPYPRGSPARFLYLFTIHLSSLAAFVRDACSCTRLATAYLAFWTRPCLKKKKGFEEPCLLGLQPSVVMTGCGYYGCGRPL